MPKTGPASPVRGTLVHALRFDRRIYTPSDAQAWAKDAGYKISISSLSEEWITILQHPEGGTLAPTRQDVQVDRGVIATVGTRRESISRPSGPGPWDRIARWFNGPEKKAKRQRR